MSFCLARGRSQVGYLLLQPISLREMAARIAPGGIGESRKVMLRNPPYPRCLEFQLSSRERWSPRTMRFTAFTASYTR